MKLLILCWNKERKKSMIKFTFLVKNPWAKDVYLSVFNYDKKLSKNKSFEAEHFYCNYHLVYFSFDTSWRGEDHAGPELELGLFGYSAKYKIYDHRHWNYKIGDWYKSKPRKKYI